MTFLNFADFFKSLENAGMQKCIPGFRIAVDRALARPDGNLRRWQSAFENLPEIAASSIELDARAITVDSDHNLSAGTIELLCEQLRQLMPWRKGPFSIFGQYVDSEWRSDLKWDRLKSRISSLAGRKVLDVGCGNGYHMFRMLGEQASLVVGADPSLLFLAQFSAIKKYAGNLEAFLLPLGIEELPETGAFDSVFSMGVLYHRRSPFDFLRQLRRQLRPGGELILETLVIDGDRNQVLVPGDRYARMKNVWFIPSAQAIIHWLNRSGFTDSKMVDLCKTTCDEQRATAWMTGESLHEALSPEDSRLTVEGYPAPVRAVFVAQL